MTMKKRALITSGGGAKGAFTVGALEELRNQNITNFDIVSGTSTGALIAALAIIHKIDTLVDIYTNIQNTDIIAKQNLLSNLANHRPFIFDSEPLQELIHKYITDDAYTAIVNANANLCLSAVSLQTGGLTIFCTKPVKATKNYKVQVIDSAAMLRSALLASSNVPAFFPLVTINGEQFVDGGTREVIPSQVVVDAKPDEIFVLSNIPITELSSGKSHYTEFLDVLMRSISIFLQDVKMNDKGVLERYRNATKARLVYIEPDEDLDPENPTGLRFDKNLMTGWMNKGRITAREVLEK